jgi:adenylylsulfate kinase
MIQLTGLSGAGKTTLARKVKDLLERDGFIVLIIDGDEYRKTLCKDLGFSKTDRLENIRRLGQLANTFVQQEMIAIIAAINPYEQTRQELRDRYNAKTVWLNCDLEELIRRDTKGLYKRALLPDNDPEKISNLTGVNDVYENPVQAELILNTHEDTPEQSAQKFYDFIIGITGK